MLVASSLCKSGRESSNLYVHKKKSPENFFVQSCGVEVLEPLQVLKVPAVVQLPRAESNAVFGRLTGLALQR